MIIIETMSASVDGDIVVICEIACAAPVLVLFVKKSVTNEVAMTSVFIDPSNIKYSLVDDFFVILVAMVAA